VFALAHHCPTQDELEAACDAVLDQILELPVLEERALPGEALGISTWAMPRSRVESWVRNRRKRLAR